MWPGFVFVASVLSVTIEPEGIGGISSRDACEGLGRMGVEMCEGWPCQFNVSEDCL